MTTGQQVLDAAALFLGEPYSTAPGRTSPTSGYKDCSGLVAAAYEVATGTELGAYVTVTIYAQSAQQGLAISRDEALTIPGACLLIPEDPMQGWGPNGHIGFSTGDGWTIEATPAARGGVQRLPVNYQPWGSHACLLPGIYYGGPLPEEDRDMPYIAVGDALMGRVAALIDGGQQIGDLFTGPADATTGIPQSAIAWNTQPGRGLDYVYYTGDNERFAAVLAPPQSVPGDCPPGVSDATDEALIAELARRLA